MLVSAAIQHHPSRRDLLAPLLRGLSGLSTEIIEDPAPDERLRSAWRTYRLALEQTPADATHRLVIQDDATPCRSFATVMERAIVARPDKMLILCVCGLPILNARDVLKAGEQGWSWAPYTIRQMIVSAIAIVWPARLIQPTLDFIDAQNWHDDFTSDDERIAKAMFALGETPLATVPSLVDHRDEVPSVCMKSPKYGNPARLTACFVPDWCDPLTIDWTLGPR